MATIGQILSVPETGWTRYNNTNAFIIYTGTWTYAPGDSARYMTDSYYSTTNGSSISFGFYGTKLRIIGTNGGSVYDDNIKITIDKIDYYFSEALQDSLKQTLNFEILNLSNSKHTCKINVSNSKYVLLDAIDLDTFGSLDTNSINYADMYPSKVKTSLSDMQTGDCIPFQYDTTATGVVGGFSNLGTANGKEIPTTGIAIPNDTNGNKAYFVKNAKGMLIADRVIQHSVSWDALNSGKMIEGALSPIFSKLPNPVNLPTGNAKGLAYSNSGDYIVVGCNDAPCLLIYKMNGDIATKLTDPANLPNRYANSIAFSPDDIYMSVAHQDAPFITIYKRNGDTFTKLANPSILPTGNGQGVAFSPDGNYMSVAHNTDPFITIYKRSGDTFTKLANPSILPTGYGYRVAFSPDSNYMSVAHYTAPFITIYKRSGDTFTKLANPNILPTGDSTSLAFSPDGTHMLVGGTITPFITIYKKDGDVFTKLSEPSVLPTNSIQELSFSPDGLYLIGGILGESSSIMYKRNGDIFTKLPNLNISPAIYGRSIAFSPDGIHLAMTFMTSPFVIIYKKNNMENTLIRSLSGGNSYVDYTNKRIVSLLLHGDGADGSTVFTDNSPNPKVVTKGNNSMIKTDQSKFGGSSIWSGYANSTIAYDENFNFGAYDFSIEMWIRPTSSGEVLFATNNGSGYGLLLDYYANKLRVCLSSSNTGLDIANSVFLTSPLIQLNQWNHIALVRNGNSIKGYVGGISDGSTINTSLALYNTTTPIILGVQQGYIDEVRIIKYKAEYTSNFTPPTAPYNEPTNILEGAFSSTTDKGLGAYPEINEWDKYIVNSDLDGKIVKGDDNVWHWNNGITTCCKETSINNAIFSNGTSANTTRIIRGKCSGYSTYINSSLIITTSTVSTLAGFRPVLEYLETDSKATDLFK
jgi:WD40 repeat protein